MMSRNHVQKQHRYRSIETQGHVQLVVPDHLVEVEPALGIVDADVAVIGSDLHSIARYAGDHHESTHALKRSSSHIEKD